MGIPWETALAGTLVSGIIFCALTATGLREKIINAIPLELKLATGAGIGLFIAFIGLRTSTLVVSNPRALLTLLPGTIMSALILWNRKSFNRK